MSETSPAFPAAPGIAFLDDRAIIAIGGKDCVHFLHNLLTANIEALKPGAGTLAALLTPQGKIITDMLVFNASDEEPLFLIDVPRGFSEDLASRLSRYRLRADVTIDLIEAPVGVAVLLDSPPASSDAFYIFPDPRHPALGQRVIGPHAEIETAFDALPKLTPGTFHQRRVMLAIAEGGKDYFAGAIFPHEANFDRLHGVDFRKGCYIGQEVVSRMEHRGTARTRAVPIRFANGFGVLGGSSVVAGTREIGRIGEVYEGHALAFIRLDKLAEARASGEGISAGGVGIVVYSEQYT